MIINTLKKKLTKYNIKPQTLFYLADKDDSKTITLLELRDALQTVLPHNECTPSDILKIMQAFDKNQDYMIDRKEYMKVFENEITKDLKTI